MPLIASIQLTPSLDQVLKQVPPASSQFHASSVAEDRQSVLNSVRMELAEIPDVKRMSPEALDQLTKPIADFYSSISPATSAALSSFLPTRTAVRFSLLSITVSLLTFCVSFTLFRRQWRHLFSHPQQFFRGSSGRFLHVVDNSVPTTADDSSFLYLSVAEFNALQELAQETLRRPTLTPNPTTCSITNPPPHPVVASDTTSANPNRVYSIVTAPVYQETSSKFGTHNHSTSFSTLCLIYMYISLCLTVCLYMATYPIFFITHDALRRVSAFLFSYSSLSGFLACFPAHSAVVCFN